MKPGCWLLTLCLWLPPGGLVGETRPDLPAFTAWLREHEGQLDSLAFAAVIEASTGRKVLSIDPADPATRRVLGLIETAASETLQTMNAPDSPTLAAQRINEASRYFEDALREKLNAAADLACDYPLNARGEVQRSGYPDLRVVDRQTGAVYYLDPKVHAQESRDSSFRTFYYEPKTATSKVLEDAHHLVLGVVHETAAGQPPRFRRWELIDLSELRVRLKAEFSGSNRDLYRPEAVVAAGEAP